MRSIRIIHAALAILFLSSFCPASAAPVSGTHPIVDGSIVAIACEYDYVYERDLEASAIISGSIEEQNTFSLKLLFESMHILTVYAKAGVTSFKLESQLNNGNILLEDYAPGFSGGGGLKFVQEFIPRVRFAADAQANWWKCNLDDAQHDGTTGGFISEYSGDASAFEIQLAGILSYEIDYQSLVHPIHGDLPIMVPYAGLKYAYFKIDTETTAVSNGQNIDTPDNIRNDNKLGFVCGLDIRIPSLDGFTFNIEGRFIDDNSLSGYLKYNF